MGNRFKYRIPVYKNNEFDGFIYLTLGDKLSDLHGGRYGMAKQCTGLKDKNGKLIYEGDLIKEPANKYPLEIYYDKGAWLTREYRKNGNNEQLLYALINCYGVEVIGNTHENADLLGEE